MLRHRHELVSSAGSKENYKLAKSKRNLHQGDKEQKRTTNRLTKSKRDYKHSYLTDTSWSAEPGLIGGKFREL